MYSIHMDLIEDSARDSRMVALSQMATHKLSPQLLHLYKYLHDCLLQDKRNHGQIVTRAGALFQLSIAC
jgi:hypothetical protein